MKVIGREMWVLRSFFFFSSRRRHTRLQGDWSSDVCSSDLNSWATFQASPVVIAEGTDLQRAWAATWNPTWWPVNIHRLIANVVLGGFMCGAYAGVRYLAAQTPEERDHYDWMGYVGNFIGVFGMLPLPFA